MCALAHMTWTIITGLTGTLFLVISKLFSTLSKYPHFYQDNFKSMVFISEHVAPTSCRLKVSCSCSLLLRAGPTSPQAGHPGTESPRDRAPRTRLSCRCFSISSSHSHAKLASRRSLFRLRSSSIFRGIPRSSRMLLTLPSRTKAINLSIWSASACFCYSCGRLSRSTETIPI